MVINTIAHDRKVKISILSMLILPWCGGRGLSIRILTSRLRNERKTALRRLLLTRAGASRTACTAYAAVPVFQTS